MVTQRVSVPSPRYSGARGRNANRYNRNRVETDNTIRQVKWLVALFAVTWSTFDDLVRRAELEMKKRLQRPTLEQLSFADAFYDNRRSFLYTKITIDAVSNPAQPVLFNATPFDQLAPSLPLPNW